MNLKLTRSPLVPIEGVDKIAATGSAQHRGVSIKVSCFSIPTADTEYQFMTFVPQIPAPPITCAIYHIVVLDISI